VAVPVTSASGFAVNRTIDYGRGEAEAAIREQRSGGICRGCSGRVLNRRILVGKLRD